MGLSGAMHIADDLAILHAFNPVHGLWFVANNGTVGLLALGAVFLAVTRRRGALHRSRPFRQEAHPVRLVRAVFPCLTLNYLGQGAMVLANPATIENPFF